MPDDDIKVIHDDKEVQCKLIRTILECKIDNNTFGYDIENPDKYKEYELKIVDSCNTELYSFIVNIKNSSSIEYINTKEEGNKKK